MKNYLIALFLTASTGMQGSVNQPPFVFEKTKDFMTSIRNSSIKLGESVNLTGYETNVPGIYLEDRGASYIAYRLSVVPPQSLDRWKPYLQTPTHNSIVISWKDAGLTQPIVKYGKIPEALNSIATGIIETLSDEKASFKFNKVTLTNLESDTKYYYQVSGDETVYSFRTFPADNAANKIRVLFMGDHHMPERSSYEWLIASAKQVIGEKYGPYEDNLNLVMNLGDQVDRAWLDQYERNHFYKSSYLSTAVPVMTTVGNHDLYEDEDLAKYKKLYSYETLSYAGIESGTEAYYAFRCGAVLFLVTNTEPEYTNEVQLAWIRNIIAAADKDESIQFILSTCHRPVCSETWIDDYSPWLKNIAAPVLGSSSKFVLNMAGHHHYYHRGQMENQNFHHIVTGGAPWDQLWADAATVFDDNLIQKTHDYWTYVLVEFDPVAKQMTAETYSIGHTHIGHDNLLIDRFVRDLNDVKKPAKPQLNKIDENPSFPFVISALPHENSAEFNTAQFQISSNREFNKPVIDKMLHYENFFKDGGAPYYLPTNTQKDKSCYEYIVNESDLDNGSYYVRVRYRNQNLMWSEWSDIQYFDVKKEIIVTPDTEPLISFDKTLYKKGEPISVSFRNIPTGTGAWIGMYQQGDDIPGLGTVGYAYTDQNSTAGNPGSGKATFTHSQHGVPLPVGKFFFMLFGDSGYDRKLTPRMEFNITESEDPVEIITDKKHYDQGEVIRLSFKGATGNSKDWIGFYLSSHTVGVHSTDLFRYLPPSVTDGTIVINDILPAGCYYISYFVNDSYEERAQRKFITIGNKPELSLNKQQFLPNEDVCFQLKSLPEYPLCWLQVKDRVSKKCVYKRFVKTLQPNQNIFTRFNEGLYEVSLILPDEDSATESVVFSVSSQGSNVTEMTTDNIFFFPNPVDNFLFFESDQIQKIEIFDYKGVKVMEKNISSRQIDLTHLNAGVFIIRMSGENLNSYQSIIKK